MSKPETGLLQQAWQFGHFVAKSVRKYKRTLETTDARTRKQIIQGERVRKSSGQLQKETVGQQVEMNAQD